MSEKKNPDYTKSAVKLTNPPQVKELLEKLHQEQKMAEGLKLSIPPDIRTAIEGNEKRIADITAQIKSAIQQFGSYQDVEAGVYGVYNRRVTKEYHAGEFKAAYPKLVPAVIEESVNINTLKGMIKGGVITEDDLKAAEVITESEAFAYYIR